MPLNLNERKSRIQRSRHAATRLRRRCRITERRAGTISTLRLDAKLQLTSVKCQGRLPQFRQVDHGRKESRRGWCRGRSRERRTREVGHRGRTAQVLRQTLLRLQQAGQLQIEQAGVLLLQQTVQQQLACYWVAGQRRWRQKLRHCLQTWQCCVVVRLRRRRSAQIDSGIPFFLLCKHQVSKALKFRSLHHTCVVVESRNLLRELSYGVVCVSTY